RHRYLSGRYPSGRRRGHSELGSRTRYPSRVGHRATRHVELRGWRARARRPRPRRAPRPDAPAGRIRHAIVGLRPVKRYLGFLLALAAIVVASPPVLAAGPVAEMGVPDGYRRVAAAHGIPSELFYAVALAESGRH